MLKQYGLIEFRTHGTKATEYKLNTISNSFQDSLQVDFQDSLQVGLPLNKQNKTKPKQNKTEKETSKKKFIPPTLEEVQQYVQESGLVISAKKFVDYYEATGWKDAKGNPVKSWKGKAQTWNSKEEREKNNTTKRGATFADLLREEYGDDQERNNADNEPNADILSEILPEYDIR